MRDGKVGGVVQVRIFLSFEGLAFLNPCHVSRLRLAFFVPSQFSCGQRNTAKIHSV